MTLQVIRAEDVRDGEPRLWCSHSNGGIGKTQGVLHTESRRESGCQVCEFAIVDRHAPNAVPGHLAAVRAALAVNPSHLMAPSIAAVCDELERMQRVDDAMLKEAGRLSAKLREAKRLVLEACDAAQEAESRADHERDGRLTSPRTSAAIRAELEKL